MVRIDGCSSRWYLDTICSRQQAGSLTLSRRVGLRAGAFFVVRARDNMLYRRYSHPVDKSTGLRSDQTIVLTGKHKDRNYPDPARLVRFVDCQPNARLCHKFRLPLRRPRQRPIRLISAWRTRPANRRMR